MNEKLTQDTQDLLSEIKEDLGNARNDFSTQRQDNREGDHELWERALELDSLAIRLEIEIMRVEESLGDPQNSQLTLHSCRVITNEVSTAAAAMLHGYKGAERLIHLANAVSNIAKAIV